LLRPKVSEKFDYEGELAVIIGDAGRYIQAEDALKQQQTRHQRIGQLEREVFTKFADSSLILVNADFPRSSKNRLPAAQQKINDALADIYNKEGHFPYTVLLKPDGTVIKTWDGLPKGDAAAMMTEIKAASSLAYP
jgi:hypothetical protein